MIDKKEKKEKKEWKEEWDNGREEREKEKKEWKKEKEEWRKEWDNGREEREREKKEWKKEKEEKEKKKEKKKEKPGRKSEGLSYLGGLKKLSPTELEFMKVIWKKPGISSEEIYNNPEFKQPQGTKATILFKINEKGYLDTVQRGLHHFYYPKITAKEYAQAVNKQKWKNRFGDISFMEIIASFCGKASLTVEQIEKISKLLEEIMNEESDE